MWANRLGCSPKISEGEQFTQVTHQKWARESNSLRSLTINERGWANRSFAHFFLKKNKRFAQKTDEQIPNPAVNDRRRINTEDKAKVVVVCLVDGIDSISSPKKQRRPMLFFCIIPSSMDFRKYEWMTVMLRDECSALRNISVYEWKVFWKHEWK